MGRFFQMMWRLNFLVLFCCLVLNNSYMLYYICPMHTLFTIMVYGGAGAGEEEGQGGKTCGRPCSGGPAPHGAAAVG